MAEKDSNLGFGDKVDIVSAEEAANSLGLEPEFFQGMILAVMPSARLLPGTDSVGGDDGSFSENEADLELGT